MGRTRRSSRDATGQGRRRLALVMLGALVWTGVWSATPVADVGGAEPAAAQPVGGSARCTEGGTAWRVEYTAEDGTFGTVIRVANLFKKVGTATEQSANGETWALRHDWLPSDHTPGPGHPYGAPDSPSWDPPSDPWPDPIYEAHGSIAVSPDLIRQPIVDYLSPRLVSPDGACTVYLSPFANLRSATTAPRIGVLGDTLLSQLDGAAYPVQGRVEVSLNALGIRTEVEGHHSRSLGQDLSQTAPLEQAKGFLNDEYRGLLEHDVDGVVVALGTADALRVAVEPAATRAAKRTVVHQQLNLALDEMTRRHGCVALVTGPEQSTFYGVGAYPTEALAINELLRTRAAASPTDALELVDFAARARGHRTTDPNPGTNSWFTDNNYDFNDRGKTEYTADLTRAAQRCAEAVVVHGQAGTLTTGSLAGLSHTNSGQRVTTRAVNGWGFPGGRRPWWSTVAADNTILMGDMSLTDPIFTTGNSMDISTFNADTGSFTNIPVATDTGETSVGGYDLADMATIDNGNAAVFAGGSGGSVAAGHGQYPVFGVVTKNPTTGAWEIAKGPGWENQWSPVQLREATIDGDPISGQLLADQSCPLEEPIFAAPYYDCMLFTTLDVLPQSGDVVMGTYFGRPKPGGPAGAHVASGHITVIHLDGPDASGRYTARVTAAYQLPEIDDPQNPAVNWAEPRIVSVEVDPTSVANDERFLVTLDVYSNWTGPDGAIVAGPIEFSYNAGHTDPNQRIRNTSAPLLYGGDPVARPPQPLPVYAGLGPMHYDQDGNLWAGVSTPNGMEGIAVYAKRVGGGRTIGTADCGFNPATPLPDYVAGDGTTVRRAWGQICKPDYLILQPRSLHRIWDLEEDPVSHNILATVFGNGTSYVIDPDGQGEENMTFRVSNVVTGHWQGVVTEKLSGWMECPQTSAAKCRPCPSATPGCSYPTPCDGWLLPPCNPCSDDSPDYGCEPCPPGSPAAQQGFTSCIHTSSNPDVLNPRETRRLVVDLSLFDYSGRIWLPVAQMRPALPKPWTATDPMEQWLISIDSSRLLGRGTTTLTSQAGGAGTTLQAEASQTLETSKPSGTHATYYVDSRAPVAGGGTGLVLTDETTPGTGVAAGTTATFTVAVPKPGQYQVSYQARRAPGPGTNPSPRIRLQVDGTGPTYDTGQISTTSFGPVGGPTLTFSEARTYTITLSVPPGSHGWQLDWLKLTRN